MRELIPPKKHTHTHTQTHRYSAQSDPFHLPNSPQLTFADRLAFYSCAAKETGDLLGGAGGIQVALDSVCDAGQSADALVSISLIRDCLM